MNTRRETVLDWLYARHAESIRGSRSAAGSTLPVLGNREQGRDRQPAPETETELRMAWGDR